MVRMRTGTCAITIEYTTSADVARVANQRGDSLTAAGVRLAAVSGRLRTAAVTPRGVRLFLPADVEEFLAIRAARRAQRGAA